MKKDRCRFFYMSNLTPAMLGPKLSPPRNQERVSCVIHLSPPACLLFHRSKSKEQIHDEKGPVTVFLFSTLEKQCSA